MPANDILSRPDRLDRCDPAALAVANQVSAQAQCQLTVLFGSRAKGTWHRFSDLDLLLIADWYDDEDKEQVIYDIAREVAKSSYTDEFVPVNIALYGPADLDLYSRSVNHVIRRALNYGILLPECYYNDARYCQPPANYSGEPLLTQSIISRVQDYRQRFQTDAAETGLKHDPFIGRNAHQAVNSALKALISANYRKYPITWDIYRLRTAAVAIDPQFHWTPNIDLACYNQYAPDQDDDPASWPLSNIPDYARLVYQDIDCILSYAITVHSKQRTT